MIKKMICFLLIFILAASCLSCDTAALSNGAATVGYAFANAVANQDYAEAYTYLYENSDDLGSEEEFAARFTNIFDAMKITNIVLSNRTVAENGELFTVNYTLTMTSTLMGTVSYDYQAEIIPAIDGYKVMYAPSLILPFMETGDTVLIKTEYGQRGEIFDANKNLLAKNDYAQTVYIETAKVTDINALAQSVNAVLGVDPVGIVESYNNAVENSFDLATIQAYPKNTFTQQEKDAITAITGVGVDEDSLTPIRYYPMQDSTAHVVGYMGSPSEEEISAMADAGITEDSKIGKTGLEAVYEEQLRPTDGFKLYVQDSLGNEKKVLYEEPKQDGEDIVLTLDSDIQNKAYTLLSTNLTEGQSGAVIIMDYTTGDVEGMVSYPSFDPNYFSFPMDGALWAYLNSKEALTPLFSRATQAIYPPGSTFKVFSVVPAFEGGLIGPTTIPDLTIVNNEWVPDVEGWVYPSIKRTHETLGDFNMINALKSSDNIFYAYTAMLTGIDPFMAYMNKIGLGDAPSFELPVTKSNLLNEGTEMNIKILADMGYGMAELQVSPIQLASMYTAIMNEGDILNPTVVDSLYKTEGEAYTKVWENERTVFKEDIMQSSTIDTLKEALRLVVQSGTAYESKLDGVNMMGKTGTAQIGEDKAREVSWLILMGEDEGNQKLVLVMLDTKTDEGDARYSIGRELMKPEGYVDTSEEAGAEESASAGETVTAEESAAAEETTAEESAAAEESN